MFGVNLVVPIALDDFCRALGGFLCSFSKTVKSHHKRDPFPQFYPWDYSKGFASIMKERRKNYV
jgi:hypothetical protein